MEPTSFCANAVAEKNIAIATVSAAREEEIQPGVDALLHLSVDILAQREVDLFVHREVDTLSVTG
jgi:hypothetical protein